MKKFFFEETYNIRRKVLISFYSVLWEIKNINLSIKLTNYIQKQIRHKEIYIYIKKNSEQISLLLTNINVA